MFSRPEDEKVIQEEIVSQYFTVYPIRQVLAGLWMKYLPVFSTIYYNQHRPIKPEATQRDLGDHKVSTGGHDAVLQ